MLLPLGSFTLASMLSAALTLAPVAVDPPPASQALTRAAALVARAAATSAVGAWEAPLSPPLQVLRGFELPASDWLPGHRGVDLAAAEGAAVRAAGAGRVRYAGDLAGRGVVSVLHPDGRRTTYEPVEPVVTVGDLVDRGELLGWLATGTGHCGAEPTCLHWGLRRDEDYQDPLSLLRRGRPVLLPVEPGPHR